jgi:hypothetical protein
MRKIILEVLDWSLLTALGEVFRKYNYSLLNFLCKFFLTLIYFTFVH